MDKLHSKLKQVSDSARKFFAAKFMTLFLMILSLAIPSPVNGQSLYKDGMTWDTYVGGTHDPYGEETLRTVTLEQSSIDDCFKVYSSYEDQEGKTFVCLLKTEGKKVYFKKNETESGEWYLMYDFGLIPGEGCFVYNPEWSFKYNPETGEYQPQGSYVECVAIEPDAEWPVMVMDEPKEDPSNFRMKGFWIQGLSSMSGLLWNNGFNMIGGWSHLSKVTCDGKVLYSKAWAGIRDVSDSVNPSITVKGRDVCVTVDDETPGSLYTPSGVRVGTYTFCSTPTHVQTPSEGIYILKIGNTSKKIMIP